MTSRIEALHPRNTYSLKSSASALRYSLKAVAGEVLVAGASTLMKRLGALAAS